MTFQIIKRQSRKKRFLLQDYLWSISAAGWTPLNTFINIPLWCCCLSLEMSCGGGCRVLSTQPSSVRATGLSGRPSRTTPTGAATTKAIKKIPHIFITWQTLLLCLWFSENNAGHRKQKFWYASNQVRMRFWFSSFMLRRRWEKEGGVNWGRLLSLGYK